LGDAAKYKKRMVLSDHLPVDLGYGELGGTQGVGVGFSDPHDRH
jgi:hypothetical protein